MQIKDMADIIRNQIEKYGQPCEITLSNGEVITTYAMTKRLWQNDKTKLEADMTRLGKCEKHFLAAYFPCDFDAKSCGEDDILFIKGEEFYFVKATTYCFGDEALYHYCILRRIETEDDNVFE